MTIYTPGEYAHFIATSRSFLDAHGITVTFGTDFHEYQKIINTERTHQRVGNPFDPERHNFNENNAFWVVGRNQNGELVSTQAAKKVDTKGRSLASYLMRDFREYPPVVPDLNMARSRFRASPGAQKMDGQMVYHGDAWLRDSPDYRGTGLLAVFCRMALLEIAQRFDPDHVFGFIVNALGFKGLGMRMGYFHMEPGALRWFRNGSDKPIDVFMCHMSRDDLGFLFEVNFSDVLKAA